MAVLKEFKCLAHGAFDAKEAVCPQGCTTVVREFRTAPGGKSAKTKTSDKALQRLAKRFGLTDMSNRDGSVGASRRHRNDMTPIWGEMPKGNVFQVGKGEVPVDGSQGGATSALTAIGMTGSVAEILSKKYGKPMEAEPQFMDIAKSLPRVRPHVIASQGTSRELEEAIKKAP